MFQKASKIIAKDSELQNTLQIQESLQDKNCKKHKSKKKTKVKQSKNALANHSSVSADKPLSEKGKGKFREKIMRYGSSSKYFEALSSFPKEENNNTPLVVLHHRGEKPFKKSKERIPINNKNNPHLSTGQTQILQDYKEKKKNGSTDNNYQSKCKEKGDDTSLLKNMKPSKDKIKNRPDKYALSETPNNNAEPKLKVKKPKHSKQNVPVVVSSSNPNDIIINQMKDLPIRFEDNPLAFMNVFRTANVFNGHKDKKKFDNVIKQYCEKLKQEEIKNSKNSPKLTSKEHINKVLLSSESLRKQYMSKRASSKLLKGANSRKRLKKCKNRSVMLNDTNSAQENLENAIMSSNNTKSRKDFRKKIIKHLTSENFTTNNNLITKLETMLSKEKVNLNAIKAHKKYLTVKNNFKESSLNYRSECGDGLAVDCLSKPSSQNNKLSTIYSESLSAGTAEKDSMENDQLNVNTANCSKFEIPTKSNVILRKNDNEKCDIGTNFISTKDVGKISIVKPSVSEDGKKLTFQLVKTGFVPKNITKLNNRLDRKRLVKTSKESLPLTKDKLMLFYAKRESSCTSKDSLKIAISRDTEISNDGASNNVLNVVIKQTKSSLSNSKTPSSRDCDVENDFQGTNDSKIQRTNVHSDGLKTNAYINGVEEFSFQTYKLLAGDQTESSLTATNSQEVDSKQSVFLQINDDKQKYLNKSSFGICCLQHSNQEENEKISFKNTLKDKLFNLKSTPETTEITQLSHCMFLPESKATVDYKNISLSNQKNNLKSKQQTKSPRNSPRKNKFYTVFNPDDTENLKTSLAQGGYKKENCEEMTRLIKAKNANKVTTQFEPMNNYKLCSNNQSVPKDQDNLGSKLQDIGLTQKKRFVTVIESENVPNESKIINNVDSSELKREERHKPFLVENFQKGNKKEYYIPTKQNKSYDEDVRNKLSIFKFEKSVKNNFPMQLNESLAVESKGNAPMTIKKRFICERHCLEEDCKATDEKKNKENFVKVLPEVVSNKTNSCLETTTSLHDEKEEAMVYSEVGVQTDFPMPQSKKDNIISFEKATDVLPLTSESSINYKNKNLCSKDNKRFANDKILPPPVKKGSFVHVVNNNAKKQTSSCDRSFSVFNKKIENTNIAKIANSDKMLNQLINNEKHKPDEQLINKVNAIYEFLLYFDKILKNTAFIKPNEVCETSSNNMGNLNKTLRCLCSNCVEILKKIEAKQLIKQENGKHLKSPERSFSTQHTKKRSQFVSEVSAQRELEWRKDDESNVEYVNISEVEKPVENGLRRAFPEPKTHKFNPKPFFVVVPSNETFSKNLIQSYGDVSKQPLLEHSEFKETSGFNHFNSNDPFLQMEDEIDSMLLKRKINNSKLLTNKVNNSEHLKKNTQSFILDKCNSSEALPLFSKKFKSFGQNTFLQVKDTIDNVSIRSGNEIKLVNSDSSLEVRHKKTVHHESFAENNRSKNYNSQICRKKCFRNSFNYLQSSESKLSNNTLEQNPRTNIPVSVNDFVNGFSHCGDGLGRKTEQWDHKGNVVTRREEPTRGLCGTKQHLLDIPLNTNQNKSKSYQSSMMRKTCKIISTKNDENLLTGSVRKNREAAKLNELNNRTNFQGIQNITNIKTVFSKPNLHVHKEETCDESNCYHNRSDSDTSINSYTCSNSLRKSSVFKNKVLSGKNEVPNQTDFSVFQNNDEIGQLVQKPVLKVNRAKHENILENKELIIKDHEQVSTTCFLGENTKCTKSESRKSSKYSLRKLDSDSSIDSLFSQNKETLVFTNRHFPCNEGFNINHNSCGCESEAQETAKKKEISYENTVYDSAGWVSLSSCEFNNTNNTTLNNSVPSTDEDKVRLQMDINLNDVMRVEFFCQPSDSVKQSKEKNKW